MIVTVTVDIACPREQVFDLMADVRNETTWNPRVSRAELTSAGAIGAGTTFLTVNRGREYLSIVSVYDRPEGLVLELLGKSMVLHGAFDFEEAGSGTAATATFSIEPRGLSKLTSFLWAGSVRDELAKDLDAFREFCEARAA